MHGWSRRSARPSRTGTWCSRCIRVCAGHDGRNTPPFPGITRTINYGVNRVRFPSPVRAGARLRGRFALVDATGRNGALQVVERFTAELDAGDKPACVAEIVRLLYFD